MLKQHADLFRRLLIFADILLAAAAFISAYFLLNQMRVIYPFSYYAGLMPYFIVTWVGLMYFLGMYNSFRTKSLSDILSILLRTLAFSFLIFSSMVYFGRLHEVSRALVSFVEVLALGLFLIEKVSIISVLKYLRGKGYNTRNVLVVGTGKRAEDFVKLTESHGELGFKILGFIDDDPADVKESVRRFKVFGGFGDMAGILHNNVVDHVVFVVPRMWFDKIEGLIHLCEIEGIPASVGVDLYELKVAKAKQTEFLGTPMLTFASTSDKAGELFLKRVFDIILSALGLMVLSPVFLITGLIIKRTSKCTVFFKQERCGLNGRKFTFYKFRTMVEGAQEQLAGLQEFNEMDGPVFKMKNDPRVTKVGMFIRRFSLDELPQLWNVLRGDMSIVGPRPPLPSEVDKYDNWQRRRLSMRPGLTCFWQSNGRNEISDFNEWMKLDLQYIDNWSLWLDLKIFLKTLPQVLLARGAK